jgi:hypothetical protein
MTARKPFLSPPVILEFNKVIISISEVLYKPAKSENLNIPLN